MPNRRLMLSRSRPISQSRRRPKQPREIRQRRSPAIIKLVASSIVVDTVAIMVMVVRGGLTVATKVIGLIPRCGMEPTSHRDIMEGLASMVPSLITALHSSIGADGPLAAP